MDYSCRVCGLGPGARYLQDPEPDCDVGGWAETAIEAGGFAGVAPAPYSSSPTFTKPQYPEHLGA